MDRRIIINITTALLISISVIAIISSFMGEEVSVNEILDREVIWLILLCLAISIGSILLDGLRICIVVSALREKIRYIDAVESCLMYSFFSAITPSSMGGQPFQIYFLTKKGIKSEAAANITLFRTFEYLLVVLGIDIYSVIFIIPKLSNWSVGKTMIILGFASSVFSTGLTWITMKKPEIYKYLIAKLKRIKKLTNFIERWEDKTYTWIDSLKLSVDSLLKNKKAVALDLFLMLISVLLYSYILFLPVIRLTGIKINFLTFFSVQTLLSSLATYIPTPGASGGLEVILYSSFKSFVVSPRSLLLGITIYRIATYYIIILGGIPLILKNQKLLWREKGSAGDTDTSA